MLCFNTLCLYCCEESITNYTSFNPRKCRCKITKIGDLFEMKTKQTSYPQFINTDKHETKEILQIMNKSQQYNHIL